jgi:hypothetical protein
MRTSPTGFFATRFFLATRNATRGGGSVVWAQRTR